MEDQLYHMDDQLNQSCAQLDSCRNNNALLRKELDLARKKPAETKEDGADAEADSSDEDMYDLTPPVIEQGEADGLGQPNPADAVPDAITVPPIIEMPERIEDSGQLGPLGEGDPFSTGYPSSQFERVTQIKLNRQLTGGYNFDGKPGDEGIMIVIEPQDAKGQYVPMAGGVTISVTDPGQSGSASRVGKWEFDEAQTAGCLKRTLLGRGIHLELPWPAEFPRGEQLQVDVAFSTIDGRRLRTQRDIKIDVVDSPSAIASQDGSPTTVDRRPWSRRYVQRTHSGCSIAIIAFGYALC